MNQMYGAQRTGGGGAGWIIWVCAILCGLVAFAALVISLITISHTSTIRTAAGANKYCIAAHRGEFAAENGAGDGGDPNGLVTGWLLVNRGERSITWNLTYTFSSGCALTQWHIHGPISELSTTAGVALKTPTLSLRGCSDKIPTIHGHFKEIVEDEETAKTLSSSEQETSESGGSSSEKDSSSSGSHHSHGNRSGGKKNPKRSVLASVVGEEQEEHDIESKRSVEQAVPLSRHGGGASGGNGNTHHEDDGSDKGATKHGAGYHDEDSSSSSSASSSSSSSSSVSYVHDTGSTTPVPTCAGKSSGWLTDTLSDVPENILDHILWNSAAFYVNFHTTCLEAGAARAHLTSLCLNLDATNEFVYTSSAGRLTPFSW
jgi:hypothetical protein